MDPLSITASVVGLMMAAGKVASMVASFTSSVQDAPRIAHAVLCDINDVQTALASLHTFLLRFDSAPESRTSLIQLDQLIITLTEAVFTFSELETLVKSLVAPTPSALSRRSRLKWMRKEEAVLRLMERLQRHKSSLSLMLNIIQCGSDLEASQSQTLLCSQIEQLLLNNQELCKRLRNLEDAFDARSTLTKRLEDASIFEDDEEGDSETITTRRPDPERLNGAILQANIIRFAFEDDLETSRVYQNARNLHCDASFTSSVARTRAWSIFSGLSLADISIISVIALPVYSKDIENNECYTFGLAKEESEDVPLSAFVQASEVPQIVAHNEAEAPTNHGQRIEGDSGHSGTDCEKVLDIDDIEYSCRGCKEPLEQILVEGKAFELAGLRWHVECFRCETCSDSFDSDSNIIFRSDGVLRCNNCVYSCHSCGSKIEDLAILTGDQAFCADCFHCRNCKRKIENLRYARTSQGIFCMSCHESLVARRRAKERAKTNAAHRQVAQDDTPMEIPASTKPLVSPDVVLASLDFGFQLPSTDSNFF